jgi:hypothetical protein
MEAHQQQDHPVQPAILANTTTKDDLLRRAKNAIDAGERRLHEAADALAVAQEDFKATQREIAKAVGRSVSWVNRLLKWRQSGYKEHSPFGPTTTAGRVSHAKHRTKASKPRKASIEPKAAADDAEASAAKRKAEYAEQVPDAATGVIFRGPRSAACAKALAEFKVAVDIWFELMDYEARREAAAYANVKVEAA